MLRRVSALIVALALGSLMLGCQPAEQGGGGGGTMEKRHPSGTMASPSPGTGGGGGMGERGTSDTQERGMPGGTP